MPRAKLPYTEMTMAAALARQRFDDAVIVVDNCNWPGHECDLLVVKKNLRVIDCEIKISRADLKADAKKYKWRSFSTNGPLLTPRNVWQHYYAMPAEIFEPGLLEFVSPASGIILVQSSGSKPYNWGVTLHRRAKPQKGVEPLTQEQVIAIARLAGFRMWSAYESAGWIGVDTPVPM